MPAPSPYRDDDSGNAPWLSSPATDRGCGPDRKSDLLIGLGDYAVDAFHVSGVSGLFRDYPVP